MSFPVLPNELWLEILSYIHTDTQYEGLIRFVTILDSIVKEGQRDSNDSGYGYIFNLNENLKKEFEFISSKFLSFRRIHYINNIRVNIKYNIYENATYLTNFNYLSSNDSRRLISCSSRSVKHKIDELFRTKRYKNNYFYIEEDNIFSPFRTFYDTEYYDTDLKMNEYIPAILIKNNSAKIFIFKCFVTSHSISNEEIKSYDHLMLFLYGNRYERSISPRVIFDTGDYIFKSISIFPPSKKESIGTNMLKNSEELLKTKKLYLFPDNGGDWDTDTKIIQVMSSRDEKSFRFHELYDYMFSEINFIDKELVEEISLWIVIPMHVQYDMQLSYYIYDNLLKTFKNLKKVNFYCGYESISLNPKSRDHIYWEGFRGINQKAFFKSLFRGSLYNIFNDPLKEKLEVNIILYNSIAYNLEAYEDDIIFRELDKIERVMDIDNTNKTIKFGAFDYVSIVPIDPNMNLNVMFAHKSNKELYYYLMSAYDYYDGPKGSPKLKGTKAILEEFLNNNKEYKYMKKIIY